MKPSLHLFQFPVAAARQLAACCLLLFCLMAHKGMAQLTPYQFVVKANIVDNNFIPIPNQVCTLSVDTSQLYSNPVLRSVVTTDPNGWASDTFDISIFPSVYSNKLLFALSFKLERDSCGQKVQEIKDQLIFTAGGTPTFNSAGYQFVATGCVAGTVPCDASFDVSQDSASIVVSTNNNFRFKSVLLDLGDGTQYVYADSILGAPSSVYHYYNMPGSYTIKKIVQNPSTGCFAVDTHTVVVPSAAFLPDTISVRVSSFFLTPNVPARLGKIYAIAAYPDSSGDYFLSKVDSGIIVRDSSPQFNGMVYTYTDIRLPYGIYSFKYIPDTSYPALRNILPSYFYGGLFWSAENRFVINSFTSQGGGCIPGVFGYGTCFFDIEGTNPGGPGFIGGWVSQGANKNGISGTATGSTVFALDSVNNVYAHTVADANGNYTFPSLPYGTYQVVADVVGKRPIPRTVTLSPANPSATNVNVEFGRIQQVTSRGDAATPATVSTQPMYPNPATSTLTWPIVSQLGRSAEAQVQVLNIEGRVVLQQAATLNANGTTALQLEVGNLPAGLYLARLSQGGATLATTRFVKAE